MKKYLPVLHAVELVTGSRPHPSTCWRWTTKGSKGVFLQTWMIGGRRRTTIDAVQRFIDDKTATPSADESKSKVGKELAKRLGSISRRSMPL